MDVSGDYKSIKAKALKGWILKSRNDEFSIMKFHIL
jgi:hypothetical protein